MDATTVGAALLEYELAKDSTTFDALAVLFGDSESTFAEEGADLLDELAGLFCDADGAVNDAEAFGTAYAAQSDVELTQEDFAEFADAAWLEADYAYTADDAADWLWVDAICPGGLNADSVAAWATLF